MSLDETKKYVIENKISAEFMEHLDSDGLTSKGAAAATGADLSRIIKVLCFVDRDRRCFVVIQGSKKVDTKKIPGLKKARIANAAELKEWFNLEPGCIPPINLPAEIPKYVDIGVTDLPFVIGSAGSRFVGIKIHPADILSQKNTKLIELS